MCYFLWDKQYDNSQNKTRVVTYENNKIVNDVSRLLKFKDYEILIRDSSAISILDKIDLNDNSRIMEYVSARNPFGFSTNFTQNSKFKKDNHLMKESVKCYANKGIVGYIERAEIDKNSSWIDKWKVLTPYSNNIGTELSDDNLNTIVASPNSICTETYLVIGADLGLNEKGAIYLSKYMKSKFVRFLHGLSKNSQHGTRNTYRFVPVQDFTDESDIAWAVSVQEIDKQLYEKYGLSGDEINHIESKIKAM